jgi:tRNA threonylcarbamoyladenosine biosynthesis protein TsaB
MYLLALDTATEVCGAALIRDDKVVAQIITANGNTHARVLMPTVEWMLAQAGLAVSNLDAFAVTVGPGSFTGLRIGISTAKGLATALDKPLVGVSSLEVLAAQCPEGSDVICSMIDARRGEVYWALYERRDGELSALSPDQVGPAADVAARMDRPCAFIGTGARLYADVLGDNSRVALSRVPDHLHDLCPGILARLGVRRWRTGPLEPSHQLSPVYVRRSDARPHGGQGVDK